MAVSKGRLMRVILIVGSALILVGVMLMGWMLKHKDAQNMIDVLLVDGKTKVVEFESLTLVPGEECEYTVRLRKSDIDKYKLKLDFVELEEKMLKNFARVKILANGEIVYDELLATTFENHGTVLSVDFAEEKNTELRIVYYLPIDVGNEAKNAEAIFELLLTASVD